MTSGKLRKSDTSGDMQSRGQENPVAHPAEPRGVTAAPGSPPPPAAGAHAAEHLTNDDATPGSGALTSRSHAAGKDVDGGAG